MYPEKFGELGIDCVKPSEKDRDTIHHLIMDEMVLGRFEPASTVILSAVTKRLRADGCDAVALVCTELPIVLNDGNSPLPTLDSTRLLAAAALNEAQK